MLIMTIHKDVKSVNGLDSKVEQGLFALAERLQIDEARVEFERRWDGTPPFRVSIHIVTPGPDVIAEGADQTLHAAVLKAMQALERKAIHRQGRSLTRVKSNRQAPANHRHGGRR